MIDKDAKRASNLLDVFKQTAKKILVRVDDDAVIHIRVIAVDALHGLAIRINERRVEYADDLRDLRADADRLSHVPSAGQKVFINALIFERIEYFLLNLLIVSIRNIDFVFLEYPPQNIHHHGVFNFLTGKPEHGIMPDIVEVLAEVD